MGLLLLNMKSYISCNSRKNISHNIVGGHPFPTMHVAKKMDPHKIQRLATNECDTLRTKGWEKLNIVRNVMKKTSKGKWKKRMIEQANNQMSTLAHAHNLKYVRCKLNGKSKRMLIKEWS